MASTTKVCDQYHWLLLELPTSSGSMLLGSGSENGSGSDIFKSSWFGSESRRSSTTNVTNIKVHRGIGALD